jgi:hypothetical protein
MSLQIFKEKVSDEALFSFLETVCIKMDTHYIFTFDSYKKGLFNNSITEFIEMCKKHYFPSKYIYLDRKMTYNAFTTILRQICKANKIPFSNKIKYDRSSYTIHYYIYFQK